MTVDCFVKAFQHVGYKICMSESFEDGAEKIAIFGHKAQDGTSVPTHAALQLPNGKWTSKLGQFEDITHSTVDALSGPVYGRPLVFMSRPRPSA